MQHLATIFENIEDERHREAAEKRNRGKRLKDKKLYLKDPLDILEKKRLWNEQ